VFFLILLFLLSQLLNNLLRRNRLSLTESRNKEGKVGEDVWKERRDKNAFIQNLEAFAKAAEKAQLTSGNAK